MHDGKIIVGALMPFVTGVAFTNGLRDYMAGDLLRQCEDSRGSALCCIYCYWYRLRAACWYCGVGFMEIITSFIFAFIATMAFCGIISVT